MSELVSKRCIPCEGGAAALTADQSKKLLSEVPLWNLSEDSKSIFRQYLFKDFYETIAFVNAVAWVTHREDHHPDLQVDYRTCTVHYFTHAVGGLSENDFICAAKIDTLLE